jgi:glycosyltransferase involved in cell wall biosynthesis
MSDDRRNGDRLSVVVLLATDQRRGAEIRGLDIAAALRERGAVVEVMAAYPSGVTQRVEVEVLAPARHRLRAARVLRRRLRGIDVVLGLGPGSLPVGLVAVRGTPTRFVYSFVHDPEVEVSGRVKTAALRMMLRRVAAAVVMWNGATESVRGRYGLDGQRLRVVPNARRADHFVPPSPADRLAARRSFGLPADARVIALVGALAPKKRPALAFDAVALVGGAHLLVVGDGPLRADLEQHPLVAAGRVRFAGALDDPRAGYAAADILVHTSSTEAVPGTVVEAALSGVATVAIDVGGVSDVVGDDRAGVLAADDSAEAIAEALQVALPVCRSWGGRARSMAVERFSWDIVGDRWFTVLHDVGRRPG